MRGSSSAEPVPRQRFPPSPFSLLFAVWLYDIAAPTWAPSLLLPLAAPAV